MRNRDKYPVDWFTVIRPRELARAKFKCEDCGIKQRSYGYYDKKGVFVHADDFIATWATKQGFKVQRIHLQISHNDQNPENNNSENLIVRCPKCHMRHDREMNRLTRIAVKATR